MQPPDGAAEANAEITERDLSSTEGWEPPSEGRLGGWEEATAEDVAARRILSWRQLEDPRARGAWFDQLWSDVCLLRARYRLAVRTRWWEDDLRLEALCALAAWVGRYDDGDWEDPPGKLTLLFELERIEALLRDGNDPFHPARDREEFDRYVARAVRARRD